ncbi:UDP-2,4-diacetamido-2,4,6-trideoxy-beta-L-altropyranose hydrolase [Tepidibacillus fermentans]|uniref:UDP-2,4-diacetamido-2,4, 6-trideoxy-beta-L-altropyranose hydrolase n=2 Tax=Tepidibacillus fermentans TaxID=1281767 RepID=A0A4R3KIJ8_9BACI|nr:UDP-2,4-diacetamido-2,4,6-trideoxy-beta-L-altropyranose hydrolase [Tepidibacillus fermentans]TCS83309.1 UDP-2,4-diacetamido-2,4,6-trideoxy-beta-L-altropyranose hydrolase [Tepidibacillus fermentans]
MNVFIRADASYEIGTGHVMRCLTLANHLRNKEINVIFLSRELTGDLCQYIEEKGFNVHCLSGGNPFLEENNWEKDAIETISIIEEYQGPKYIIVDHYALDQNWEAKVRPFVKKIMVIDDLANRVHDCDLLLDQNLYEDMQTRYNGLVSQNCKIFLGPKYALLREEFIEARKTLSERSGKVKRILVFFGGSDPTNESIKVLRSLEHMDLKEITIDVVVGKSNLRKQEIENICNQHENMNYYCQIENMAELMVKADLAIGAGGSTTWERCYLGLPTITIIVAENQYLTTKAVEKAGAILNLGCHSEVSNQDIENALELVLNHPTFLRGMSRKALEIVGQSNHMDRLLYEFIEG